MSRSRYAVMTLLAAALLSGCGTPSDRTPEPVAVVEKPTTPASTCPPVEDREIPPPLPDLSGDHDGDGVNEVRPTPDDC